MTAPNWLAQSNRAATLFDQGKFDEARELAESALRENPNCAMAHQVIGLIHVRKGRPYEAIGVLERALSLQPDLVAAHCNLGLAWSQLGELQRGMREYEKALLLQPGHPFTRFNRALTLLKQGNYREGWPEYEWRWLTGQVARPNIPRPRWDGSPLDGRAILLHTEQGIGDTLQFLRFLPQLKQQAVRVVFACQTSLHALLKHLPDVDEWFPIDVPGDICFDWYSPLQSLPALLRLDSEAAIPRDVPYVTADPKRIACWKPRLEEIDGFKVGLCWQGSPTFTSDALRSIPLSQFEPLAEVPGVALVSLQKGPGTEQAKQHGQRLGLIVFDDLDADAPFVDTAAVMQHLDLVVTSDTAIAHLAGALARPVWLLVSTASHWTWLTERSDSPWYPTMRIFRQPTLGDWPAVFHQVAGELTRLVQGGVRVSDRDEPDLTLRIPVSAGELIDKITILQIKAERISDDSKLENVRRELDLLTGVAAECIPDSPEIQESTEELKQINAALWDIEDEIRCCEASQDFGERFIQLARSVYHTNDRRAAVKRRINDRLGSLLVEEKSYTGP